MNNKYTLPVPAPNHFSFAVRDIPDVTVEQRERVLKALHYNEFAFPAGMLTVDMLSDSGMTLWMCGMWQMAFSPVPKAESLVKATFCPATMPPSARCSSSWEGLQS